MVARTSLAALAALALLALGASPALASGVYAPGAEGSDFSWPQCGHDVSVAGNMFGVVGVNGGRPFTMNPCFGEQYRQASSGGASPAVYINLESGSAAGGYETCGGDEYCAAYNFGYNAAEYAFTQAYYATKGAVLGANTWWLDVETANDWSDRQDLNAAVVRGAGDYLTRYAGRSLGVYSTRGQYWAITGGLYAPAGVGNWVAGASDLGDTDLCGAALWPGGQVWFIQYENDDINLDQDYAC